MSAPEGATKMKFSMTDLLTMIARRVSVAINRSANGVQIVINVATR